MQGRGSGSAGRTTAQAGSRSEPGCRAGLGAWARGDPGHDQRHERDRQPGYPGLREVGEEWRMAVLRWHVQGIPLFQKEVPDVPSQLSSGYSPEGTRADVQGELQLAGLVISVSKAQVAQPFLGHYDETILWWQTYEQVAFFR